MDKPEYLKLGTELPQGDPHAISVHLPTWANTMAWASSCHAVDVMKLGFPLFLIPPDVNQLATELLRVAKIREKLQPPDQPALLISSPGWAELCCTYINSFKTGDTVAEVITIPIEHGVTADHASEMTLSLVSYPPELDANAKAFWQYSGFGISSRHALFWLRHGRFGQTAGDSDKPATEDTPCLLDTSGWYADIQSNRGLAIVGIKARIGDASSVFLFQRGTTAITVLAKAIQSTVGPILWKQGRNQTRIALFGCLDVNSYKTVEDVLGFSVVLFKSTAEEIDKLEELLAWSVIDALFTEFPINPLFQSPDLRRLHHLSRKHKFVLVVDDTASTSVNVDLFDACDVVLTSLSSMFSGKCNVTGGAVRLARASPFYKELHTNLAKSAGEDDDVWFHEDLGTMWKNCQDYEARVRRASSIAEELVDYLRQQIGLVAEVYYPRGSPTQAFYDEFRRPEAGYGFLLSVWFVAPICAVAFYDNLHVCKGPGFETDFTLCCAYTVLTHYHELERAAEYGVAEYLVRISVGVEGVQWLIPRVGHALESARKCLLETVPAHEYEAAVVLCMLSGNAGGPASG